MTGAPPLATTPVAVTPLRIEAISLTNFRAFPGPSAACFELEGKNLLVYGENGAGKSSLYYALTHFFSKSPGSIATHNNVFSGQAVDACKVAIKFVNDPKAVEWTTHYLPCVSDFKNPPTKWSEYFLRGRDWRISQAANRAACLDYKSLLNTNFSHGTGVVNLFDVAVQHLLHDYPVSHGGQASTLGALWEAVIRAKPDKKTQAAVAKMNQACV